MSDLVRVLFIGPDGHLWSACCVPGEVTTFDGYGAQVAVVVEARPSRVARSECVACGAQSIVPQRCVHLAEELLPHAEHCAFAAHMKRERV